jgi:SAM-dependent methyltransferase
MSEKKSLEEIRGYWEAAAGAPVDAEGLRPVARDPFLQQAVEDAVIPLLPADSSVLDIGCGDGLSTLRFAQGVKRITGVDYVERFVERAREAAGRAGVANAGFMRGDVLDLAPVRAAVGPVDVAISIRCLINLNSWERQRRALDEIAACVRPGGLYLLSEGWSEGMDGLNGLRARAAMEPIRTVDYNLLMRRAEFKAYVSDKFVVEGYVGLGFYLVMSRILQPFIRHPAPPRHDDPVNRLAASLQRHCPNDGSLDSYDYAGVYVLRRR